MTDQRAARPLYIFDLDGTLCNIEHRRRFIEGDRKDWGAFYRACPNDEPVHSVVATMARLALVSDVWIFSGRSDEVRAETVEWLAAHTPLMANSMDEILTMRREGDYTPDDQLKREWLRGMLVDDRRRLVAVFEDRDRMVRMWRSEGVPCFQVAEGDF